MICVPSQVQTSQMKRRLMIREINITKMTVSKEREKYETSRLTLNILRHNSTL